MDILHNCPWRPPNKNPFFYITSYTKIITDFIFRLKKATILWRKSYAVFLLWVPGWEIPWFLPGTLVSPQKPSTRFLFNLDLSMGFSLPNGATQPLSLNVCSGLTPPSYCAPVNFTEVPSRFHSVTSVTGWKGTVSVRWEKLFKTMPAPWENSVFASVLWQASWKAGERKVCSIRVLKVCGPGDKTLCLDKQVHVLSWEGLYFLKNLAKLIQVLQHFDFNALEFSDKCYFKWTRVKEICGFVGHWLFGKSILYGICGKVTSWATTTNSLLLPCPFQITAGSKCSWRM